MTDRLPNVFRFSLRTLFLAVTVFGCWLGYELHWIKLRANVRKSAGVHFLVGAMPEDRRSSAPGLLWLFGESGEGSILVDDDLRGQLDKLRSLFPEARVSSVYDLLGTQDWKVSTNTELP